MNKEKEEEKKEMIICTVVRVCIFIIDFQIPFEIDYFEEMSEILKIIANRYFIVSRTMTVQEKTWKRNCSWMNGNRWWKCRWMEYIDGWIYIYDSSKTSRTFKRIIVMTSWKLTGNIKQNYDRKEDKAMKHRVNTNKRRTSIDFQRFE